MHDPAEFQRQTIKAISDLQDTFVQLMSRQLALGAMTRALIHQVPLAAIPALVEEYEAEVDHQVAQLPPMYQQPKYWQEWSDALEEARKRAVQRPDQPPQD